MKQSCEICRYWIQAGGKKPYCHRNAATVHLSELMRSMYMGRDVLSSFAMPVTGVSADNWCGEWESREPVSDAAVS